MVKNLGEVLRSHLQYSKTFGEQGRRADLRDADLSGANLSGARGLIRLSFNHNLELFLVRFSDGPRAKCGCSWFTVPEARAHWQAHPNPQRRDVVLPALDAGLLIAKAQGWEV